MCVCVYLCAYINTGGLLNNELNDFFKSPIEKRSPALLSNLFQAVMMAPLFVVMEVMFKFGYRQKFQDKVQRVVDKNLRLFAEEKKNKAEKEKKRSK